MGEKMTNSRTLSWEKSWEIGVEVIDNDHKHLVDLLNKLNRARNEGSEAIILNSLFVELVQYAKGHFEREEDVFKQYNWSEYEYHKFLHEGLVSMILEKGNRFLKEGSTEEFGTEMLEFLTKWIVNHILEEDLKFKEFLNEEG